jgi:hypothetical protein
MHGLIITGYLSHKERQIPQRMSSPGNIINIGDQNRTGCWAHCQSSALQRGEELPVADAFICIDDARFT